MRLLSGIALFLSLVSGCGGGKSTIESTNEVRLNALVQIWSKHQAVNSGQVPESLEAFKAFANERAKSMVPDDVDGPDDLFVSDTDGQPFVTMFGKEQWKHEGAKVFAHEAAATDGKIWIATSAGTRQIEEEEFEKLKK